MVATIITVDVNNNLNDTFFNRKMNQIKFNIPNLTENKIVTTQIEKRNGRIYMRAKIRNLTGR